jgi:spore maturation protein B
MEKIIPLLFIVLIGIAALKKVNVYDGFQKGIHDAITFTLSLVPCLAAVFMMCELFEVSGLSTFLTRLLSPVMGAFGIPTELTKLVLIKPFSGSGTLAYLNEILASYGADSYIGRCACVLYGSTETVFYISAVYFSGLKVKGLFKPIIIVLVVTFLSTALACLLCRVM